jgi:hypothetical protein
LKSAARSAGFPHREKQMDFSSLMNYVTSLALLYAWTLFAAGVFCLGEKLCRTVFARTQPAPSGPQDAAKG